MYGRDEVNIIGKVIRKLEINEDKTAVRFTFDDGVAYLVVSGDCCSESWIEHFSGVDNLLRHTIKEIVEKELGSVMPTRQESDALYSVEFKTDGYSFSGIEFRNSSNGYYGGMAELYSTYSQRGEKERYWHELKEDF